MCLYLLMDFDLMVQEKYSNYMKNFADVRYKQHHFRFKILKDVVFTDYTLRFMKVYI